MYSSKCLDKACGKWWVYEVQDGDSVDPSSHPESLVWLGLGDKSTLVKVGDISGFWLNVNQVKHVLSRASSHV